MAGYYMMTYMGTGAERTRFLSGKDRGNFARIMKTFLLIGKRAAVAVPEVEHCQQRRALRPRAEHRTVRPTALHSFQFFISILNFNSCFQFSSCFMLYSFNFRYNVVFPIPNMRAAASLSPEVSRRVFKIARRSNSSKGRISLLSGTLSLVP
jgi:hypothetical protein